MRKFLLLCLMAIGYCGTSFAQLTLTPEQELTMLMEGDIVAIWQKTSNKFLYGSNAQNLAYGYPEDAFVESNSGWLWLVEEAEGHLLFHLRIRGVDHMDEKIGIAGFLQGAAERVDRTEDREYVFGLHGQPVHPAEREPEMVRRLWRKPAHLYDGR